MTENTEKEQSIHTLLKSAPLVTLPPQAAHSSWPDIRRPTWSTLGDKLTRQEQLVTRLLPSNQWISLRLDLKGFSSQSKRLFPSRRYSPVFANRYAQHSAGAHDGNSSQLWIHATWNPHPFNGKRDKLVSLTASFASVVLMQQFMKLGVPLPFLAPEQLENDVESGKDSSLKLTDCTVNGLSDAVHKSDLPGKRALTELNSWQKVKVLHENGLLPLEEHQAYGVFIERQVKSVEAVDLKTGLNVAVERGVLVHIPGSVLVNVKAGLINLDSREK
ncbi:hypothetical protein BDR26DRAFT_957864 [Obelidium mucronatum]|nr:hypothetical protein BDR26DRAFT_957864 [Obelidium mucronatum]